MIGGRVLLYIAIFPTKSLVLLDCIKMNQGAWYLKLQKTALNLAILQAVNAIG